MTNHEKQFIQVKDIKEGERIRGLYFVKEKRTARTRTGKPYLTMILADKTGRIEAKVWDNAQELSALFDEGHVIEMAGLANAYKGQVQANVSWLKRVPDDEVDPAGLMESSTIDSSELMLDLRKILAGIENVHLNDLNKRFLDDNNFVFDFIKTPAAKNFHHNYLGGLLEHTLSVCRLAVQVADHYPELDHDLLLTAAFLHDIGKIKELKTGMGADYTDEGRLIGHVTLGVILLDEKLGEVNDFPRNLALRLKHLILSHHGQYDFGSPKRPKFLEAFALNLIDDLDAKMNGLGRFMEKDQHDGSWTDYNRLFERYFYKGDAS
jgi:3'-5' exoribonuclease